MKYSSTKIQIIPVCIFAAAVVLCAACKPFTDDLDRFLHFWTNITILHADGSNDWKELKDAVAAAPNDTMIILIGEFKATTDSGNNGSIVITKNLTIQGKNSGGGGTLNANRAMLGTSAHRIFIVGKGGDLTLNNLTLKNGKAETSFSYGGGIVCGGNLTMRNVTVTDCQAVFGGGISLFRQGHIKLTGCTISANTAATGNGGGIYIDDGGSNEYLTVEFSGHTVIDNNNAAASHTGNGLYVQGKNAQLIFNNCSVSINAVGSPHQQDICINGQGSDDQKKMTVYGILTVKDLNGSDTQLPVNIYSYNNKQLLFGDITKGTPPNHTKFKVGHITSSPPPVPLHFNASGYLVP